QSELTSGRLSFPTPLPVVGEPVAMDLADLDGDKSPEVLYITRIKPGADTFELRALTREKSGSFHMFRWREVESVPMAGMTSVPAAMRALDVNQDGQADLLIFNQYGSPLLLLGKRDEPPRPFTHGLGPLSNATPASVSLMDLNGPAL